MSLGERTWRITCTMFQEQFSKKTTVRPDVVAHPVNPADIGRIEVRGQSRHIVHETLFLK
jgi:hypothetical protein